MPQENHLRQTRRLFNLAMVWVAYEPVWAIGVGGTPAQPGYAEGMHAHMRQVLVELFGSDSGSSIPILYGGSVNPGNAVSLALQPHIDGLFIGRSAWSVDSFLNIINMVEAALVS